MSKRLNELESWMARVAELGWHWYVKYIAYNDTYAKPNVHQGGPYVGKELLRIGFPELTKRADTEKNPDLHLSAFVASHGLAQDVRLIWYNTKRVEHRANGRDEARITNWGGMDHPLVAEAATGSLVVFAFQQASSSKDAIGLELWVTESAEEDDLILAMVGPVEPGHGILYAPSAGLAVSNARNTPCSLREDELLPEWSTELPSGEAIVDMVLARMQRHRAARVDDRLMKRRACEYEMFLSIESYVVLPRVKEGFASVEEFVRFANSVTNRRKSRAGKSLELHARAIFNEEGVRHSWTEPTEDKRTPDFVFPSIEHYRDGAWPAEKLLMLAAKTTCKDRWRQILNEAKRIPTKHLLTVQEGVSTPQFREMQDEGVRLVVPRALHQKYPDDVRGALISFEEFIAVAKSIA